VDNTLTNDWELIPFFGLATCHHYNIHVIEIDPRILTSDRESLEYRSYRAILDQRHPRTGKNITQRLLWTTPGFIPNYIQSLRISDELIQKHGQDRNGLAQAYIDRILHAPSPPFDIMMIENARKGLQKVKQRVQKCKKHKDISRSRCSIS